MKDKTENDKAAGTRFYGPPSNCNELGKLGYTLNGYYLVKGKGESLSNGIEAVLCQFKLPKDFQGKNENRTIPIQYLCFDLKDPYHFSNDYLNIPYLLLNRY